MAGMSAALTLQQAGLRVTVLEALPRVGGRNWTLRRGDPVPDILGAAQTCSYSPDQYLNAGAWRILPAHARVLALAQRFGLALEPVDPAQPWLGQRPVDGMDALARALAAALTAPISTGCELVWIRVAGPRHPGVRIGYLCDGTEHTLDVDCALLALPLNRLSAIDVDLPDTVRAALKDVEVADAIKIAFETPVRPPQAPAGDETLRLLWPAFGTPQPKRIVTVYGNAMALAQRLPPTRPGQIVQASALLRQAAGDPALPLDHPLVVQWSRMPHALGAAARLAPDARDAWRRLRAGMPPLFFAGDALSPLNGWQEGALESADHAVRALLRHLRHTG